MGISLLTKRICPETAGEVVTTPLASDPGRREGGAGGGSAADGRRVIRTRTTYSGLQVLVTANTSNGDVIIGVEQDGVMTALAVTIPAGNTGLFTNLTTRVTLEVGDLGAIQVDSTAASSGTINTLDTGEPTAIVLACETAGETVVYVNAVGGSGPVASTTKYTGLNMFGDWGTTEASVQTRMLHDGTFRLAQTYVETNARSTATVLTLRINGSDTGITITVGAGVTSRVEESSPQEVAYSAGDLVSWGCAWGSGTGAFETSQVGLEIVSDDDHEFMILLADGLSAHESFAAGDSDHYIALGGMFNTAGDNDAGIDPLLRLQLSDLYALVIANSMTADTVLTLRRDGSPTAQTVTFGASETGWQTDAGAAVDVYPGDELNYLLEISATGTEIDFVQAVMLATLVHEVTVTPSSHIAASGENATAQLTAPAGKTTGDFGGGRIQDDENPGDAVDLAADEYREDEWAFKVRSGVEIGAKYEFQLVQADGTVFATYAEVPVLTVIELPSQVLRPASDVDGGGWEDELGGTTDIYQSIDETPANDSDYVVSP